MRIFGFDLPALPDPVIFSQKGGEPSQASVLALSGANAPALPKGEPLAAPADFISLPRPLPLGEVDLRSKDGEGEQAKVKVSANKC